MFKPNWQNSNRIVKNLTAIAEARAIVLSAPLVPKWEVSLRRDAVLRSAHSSTAIEGNRLSLEEVSALAEGREIMAARKDKQEVLNYLEALDKLPRFAKKDSFTTKDFLKLHKLVTKETLDNPLHEGAFRPVQVYVGNRAGEVVFMPPPTAEVPRLVDDLLAWLNAPQINEIDPVIGAGITHYEIARIHPFVDGNGRTARVMAALVLYKRGFDVKRFFALDDYYDQDRPAYYAALKTVDQKTLDLTGWLEYFTDGVAVSLKAVKDKVVGLSKDIKVLKEKGQVALTERQMKIVEHIVQNGQISNKDVRAMFDLSDEGARKEISKLVNLDVLVSEGKGRAFHYVLN
ncbi:MAG: Fic family protein [Actinomycetota bacterium]|nr:Fic family protein [Actinomycetota bacterium]